MEALQASWKKTSTAHSARVELSMASGAQEMAGTGKLAWGSGTTAEVSMKFTRGATAERMGKLGIEGIQARYLPDGFCMNMGPQFAAHTGGRHWVWYGYATLAKQSPYGAFMSDQMQTSTPEKTVQTLLASPDVHRVAEDTVRGVTATHYSGTVDIAKLAAGTTHLDQKTLDGLKAQLEKNGVTTESIDVWVGKDGLPVKKTERTHTARGEQTGTAYYSDYGLPVDVKAPPTADTVDFATLKKQTPAQT
ncbi:putative lipoprotein [Streptomyces violascens]|nr:putative lipoprotein [Streptomyces violascens]